MSGSRRSFLAKISGLVFGNIVTRFTRAENSVSTQHLMVKKLDVNANVYWRSDSGYESNRQSAVWQAIKPKRYPDLIIQASTEADIVDTILYARSHGLPVSVRCGGHSYVASPLRNGGILLDVSRLRAVAVEPGSRLVKAQPGIRAAELSAILGQYGLAFPVAHCPTVSLGGYLLGGGMGWNGESWGQLACFNIRAVDLITASGQRITASQNTHPELFWAVRGAGPAFCAVVTRYYLEVFPLPTAIAASTYIYTMDALDSVIDWLETYKSQHHPKVELTVIFTTDNNSQSPDPRRDRRCIVSAVCFADDVTEAKTLLGAVAQGAPKQSCIHCNEYQAKTFQELLASSKAAVPIRHAVDTVWTSQSAEVLQQIGEHFIDTPSRDTHVFANYRAILDLKTDAAYSVIAPMFILSSSAWIKPEDDEACLHWSDQLMKSLQPSTEGCYINETDFMRYPERVKQCFTSESIGRLKVVRARYDPAGMFPAPFKLG